MLNVAAYVGIKKQRISYFIRIFAVASYRNIYIQPYIISTTLKGTGLAVPYLFPTISLVLK